MKTNKAKTVEEYLSPLPKDVKESLERIRTIVKKLVPEAEEKISWGMPMFHYNGMFMAYAAFRNHCSFFPCSGATLKTFEKELSPYKTSKGTVQFSIEHPIPLSLLKRIILARLTETEMTKNSSTIKKAAHKIKVSIKR